MEKLYENDSYTWEFCSRVCACEKEKNGYAVQLRETYFYPEGGGQPADWGTLGGARVLDVREKDGHVLHMTDRPLSVGEEVQGCIDGKRRLSLMCHHSAEHILSGLVHSRFGYDNVGFHMGSDCVTMDFNGKLLEEELLFLEQAANEAVRKNIAIEACYPSAEELAALEYRSKKELAGPIRIVRIPGIDICACCATHVRTTGEIGLIQLLGAQSYKGGVRIRMLAAEKAVQYWQTVRREAVGVSNLLSAKTEEIVAAVERQAEEKEQWKGRAVEYLHRLFSHEAAQYAGKKHAAAFWKGLSGNEARQFAAMLAEGREGVSAVFSEKEKGVFQYVLFSGMGDARELGHALDLAFSGKGGGKRDMVQGSLLGTEEALREWFSKIE